MDEKHDIRQELAIILPSLDPDKKLCGVCAGVADYFGIDPTIVRVIWALLAFFYGTSILLYVIMALVVPEQPASGGVIAVDSEVREPSEKKEKYKGPEID